MSSFKTGLFAVAVLLGIFLFGFSDNARTTALSLRARSAKPAANTSALGAVSAGVQR